MARTIDARSCCQRIDRDLRLISHGAPPARIRRGGRPPPPLHPRRRGAARRPVGALAPDPAARGRARHRALRAHQPHACPDRGRGGGGGAGPAGARRGRRRARARSTSCAAWSAAGSRSGRCCRRAGSTCRRLLASFSEAFPGIEVGLREGTAGDMLALIGRGRGRRRLLAARRRAARGHRGSSAQRGRGRRRLPARAPRPRSASVRAADLAGMPLVAPRSGSAIKQAAGRVLRPRRRAAAASRSRAATRSCSAAWSPTASAPRSCPRSLTAARARRSRSAACARRSACRSTCSGAAAATARRPRRRSSSSSASASRSARIARLPVPRVARRDLVADQGRLDQLDRRRGGGRAEELELLGAELGEGGLDVAG